MWFLFFFTFGTIKKNNQQSDVHICHSIIFENDIKKIVLVKLILIIAILGLVTL
jgi:hypothetical protein